MRVAPSSTAAHTGRGFSKPPSTYQRPSMRRGKDASGTAQEASRCSGRMLGPGDRPRFHAEHVHQHHCVLDFQGPGVDESVNDFGEILETGDTGRSHQSHRSAALQPAAMA